MAPVPAPAPGGAAADPRQCYTYEPYRKVVRFVKENSDGERVSGRVVIRYLRLTPRPGAVLMHPGRLLITCTVRKGTTHYSLSSADSDWEPIGKIESMDRPRLNRWLKNNVCPVTYWQAVVALENA